MLTALLYSILIHSLHLLLIFFELVTICSLASLAYQFKARTSFEFWDLLKDFSKEFRIFPLILPLDIHNCMRWLQDGDTYVLMSWHKPFLMYWHKCRRNGFNILLTYVLSLSSISCGDSCGYTSVALTSGLLLCAYIMVTTYC